MKNILRKLFNMVIKVVGFIFIRLLPLIVYLIAVYYSYILVRDMAQDTTSITNAAFAILATLAALSFSCSRALMDSDEDKDRFSYAGERFFHASLLLMSASLIKYLVLSVLNDGNLVKGSFLFDTISKISGIYIVIIFFWSVTSATGALLVANKLLWKRFNKYPDWDYLV